MSEPGVGARSEDLVEAQLRDSLREFYTLLKLEQRVYELEQKLAELKAKLEPAG